MDFRNEASFSGVEHRSCLRDDEDLNRFSDDRDDEDGVVSRVSKVSSLGSYEFFSHRRANDPRSRSATAVFRPEKKGGFRVRCARISRNGSYLNHESVLQAAEQICRHLKKNPVRERRGRTCGRGGGGSGYSLRPLAWICRGSGCVLTSRTAVLWSPEKEALGCRCWSVDALVNVWQGFGNPLSRR
ncbi:hypothetical protein U1Q18_005614 [Sarracenia purpurea var. burkii]